MNQSWAGALTLLFVGVNSLAAQEPLRLCERFPAGYQYHVSSRVELSGSLIPPATKTDAKGGPATPAPPITISGHSAIEYDERILVAAGGQVQKTVRIYRRVELQRKLGAEAQESGLRPAVRRLVVLRAKNTEVPFSPDGPLTWGEIDLIRTDTFAPALVGLLPEQPVQPGQKWLAAETAALELTDMERVEEGKIECRLEEVTTLAGRRHARISLNGTLRGINEDGPTRQQLEGFFYFDLESNHLSYLSLKGTHFLLDGNGKEAGRIEGQFVLTRQAHQRSSDLSDAALRGVVLDPNDDNTQLLYDNPDLGIRLLYGRRWRIGAVRGRQLFLDEVNGSGLVLTVDPLSRLPTAAQFLTESRTFFDKQKAKVLRADGPRRLQNPPQELEQFSLDIDMAGQKATMDYYVVRQALGGATLAARLLPADLPFLRKEVEKIARSVTITVQQK